MKQIAAAVDARQGVDTRLYDVQTLSNVTAYFLITSAFNSRHLGALCEEILDFLRTQNIPVIGKEGVKDGSDWALVDCGSFILHIFEPESRAFYDLELIWGDAPQVEWNHNKAPVD